MSDLLIGNIPGLVNSVSTKVDTANSSLSTLTSRVTAAVATASNLASLQTTTDTVNDGIVYLASVLGPPTVNGLEFGVADGYGGLYTCNSSTIIDQIYSYLKACHGYYYSLTSPLSNPVFEVGTSSGYLESLMFLMKDSTSAQTVTVQLKIDSTVVYEKSGIVMTSGGTNYSVFSLCGFAGYGGNSQCTFVPGKLRFNKNLQLNITQTAGSDTIYLFAKLFITGGELTMPV